MQFPTKIAIILPLVIYLSQILSHLCVIINFALHSNCKYIIKLVINSSIVFYYLDNYSSSKNNMYTKF